MREKRKTIEKLEGKRTGVITSIMVIILLVLATIVQGINVPAIGIMENKKSLSNLTILETGNQKIDKEFTPHDPIYINGNENFTAENGVTGGNGTKNDPYIIEGWDIDASTASGILPSGIKISNTDAYFTIRDCYIHDGLKDDLNYEGVYFDKVKNGCIKNCTIVRNDFGIPSFGKGSSKNEIKNCNVSANRIGIWIDGSYHSITRCTICGNRGHGIALYLSSKNVVLECDIKNNGDEGIFIGSTVRSIGCCPTLPTFSDSRLNLISNCHISNNYVGIEIHRDAKDNYITKCSIDNNICGIGISHSPTNNTIARCDISNNFIGVSIPKKSIGQWHIAPSNQNKIYYNNFIDNKIQAFDRCSNYWDDGNKGNYWNSYWWFDLNNDGIGDLPKYIFGGFNWDRYPVMEPYEW